MAAPAEPPGGDWVILDAPPKPAPGEPPQPSDPDALIRLRRLTAIVYALQLFSPLAGITAVMGLMINWLQRDEARGTLYDSHFHWQIRTFWWGLLWWGLGAFTVWLGVGLLVLGIALIWWLYRVIKGGLHWLAREPVPLRKSGTA